MGQVEGQVERCGLRNEWARQAAIIRLYQYPISILSIPNIYDLYVFNAGEPGAGGSENLVCTKIFCILSPRLSKIL